MLCVVGYALIAFTGNIQADYKLGKDYRLIDNPLPVRQDGMVEVSEIFWYGCGHCYNFESTINNWDKLNYRESVCIYNDSNSIDGQQPQPLEMGVS